MEYEKKKLGVGYLLGPVMAVIGIIGLISEIRNFNYDFAFIMNVIATVLMIVFGIAIVLDPNRSKMHAIAFYALALGLGRVLNSFSNIGAESDFKFFYGLALFALGASLAYSGYMYYTERSRNAANMRYISYLLIVAFAIFFAYYLHGMPSLGMEPGTLQGLFDEHLLQVLTFMMYIFYAAVLTSDEIWSNTPTGILRDDAQDIMMSRNVNECSFIFRDDAVLIKNGLTDRIGWKSGTGPVESEISVDVHFLRDCSSMLVQKWEGSNVLYMTFLRNDSDSFVNTERFALTDVIPEGGDIGTCEYVRFYGESGSFARLAVRDVGDQEGDVDE